MDRLRLKWIAVLNLCVVFGIAYLGFQNHLPYNPLSFGYSKTLVSRMVLPQGWRFFTKSPIGDRLYLYQMAEDGGLTPVNLNVSTLDNWFGIRKKTKLFTVELAKHLKKVDQSTWRPFRGSVTDLEAVEWEQVMAIRNTRPFPKMCGSYVVQTKPLIPWAWSKREVDMPSKIVRLYVVCP